MDLIDTIPLFIYIIFLPPEKIMYITHRPSTSDLALVEISQAEDFICKQTKEDWHVPSFSPSNSHESTKFQTRTSYSAT